MGRCPIRVLQNFRDDRLIDCAVGELLRFDGPSTSNHLRDYFTIHDSMLIIEWIKFARLVSTDYFQRIAA